MSSWVALKCGYSEPSLGLAWLLGGREPSPRQGRSQQNRRRRPVYDLHRPSFFMAHPFPLLRTAVCQSVDADHRTNT